MEDGERREAYLDDLTDAQIKFIFHAQNERERMKQRKAEKNTSSF